MENCPPTAFVSTGAENVVNECVFRREPGDPCTWRQGTIGVGEPGRAIDLPERRQFFYSERANPSRYCVDIRTLTGGGITRIRSKARPPPMSNNARPLRHHGDEPPPIQDKLNHFLGAGSSALPDIKASTQVSATYQSSVTASPASGSNPSRKAPSAWVRVGPRKYSTLIRLLRAYFVYSEYISERRQDSPRES